jgi:hypothetical protein
MIDDLLSNKPRAKKQVKPNALIRTDTGLERVVLKSSEFPRFDGKLGSTKRGRKGNTYRAANGYVKFAPNWEIDIVAQL